MPKPTYRMTSVDLTTEVANAGRIEELDRLELLYTRTIETRRKSIALSREAAMVSANAQAAAAEEMKVLAEFLQLASEYSPTVASEPVWMRPFKKGDHIIIESPMTTKDLRKAARISHSQLSQQASELENKYGGCFGEDDEEEDRE